MKKKTDLELESDAHKEQYERKAKEHKPIPIPKLKKEVATAKLIAKYANLLPKGKVK